MKGEKVQLVSHAIIVTRSSTLATSEIDLVSDNDENIVLKKQQLTCNANPTEMSTHNIFKGSIYRKGLSLKLFCFTFL